MYPDQIGPYRIEKKIGSGGMGNVYYGVHTENSQVAAVKVLPASLAREDGFVERFSREIQVLRTLNSHHIVRLFEDGSTGDGSWYYAMEFVDGQTLRTVISCRQKLAWTEVSRISLQIAAALKAAHDAGVVHRDIKPSNLMVTQDGTVKLTDFGVAHMFATTRLTRTGGVVGTAEYMSPEQARGQRATKRSDLYSLGAVMYVMLTGRPPFTGRNVNEILNKQQFAQIEKPRHYAPETPLLFEDLVCQLLEKQPERRVPDALVLSRRLEQIRSRIEFAESSQQKEFESTVSVANESVADPGSPTAKPHRGHQPGAATMVRNILRDAVDSQRKKSPFFRFFDNTFVLIVMMILVVSLGFYLTQNAMPTADESFKNASAMMEAGATPGWLQAREILRELQNSKALPDQADKMATMIRRVNEYEFCRTLERTTLGNGSRDSEIQRLVRRAFDRFAQGHVTQARAELKSVGIVLARSCPDGYLAEFINATLTKWEGDTSIKGRRQLLTSILNEARRAEPNSAAAAAELLQSTLMLYQEDAAVAGEIDECRRLLEGIHSQTAEQ